jgi:hypothetical protein
VTPRLIDALGGRLGVAAAVGGAVLGLDPLDGRPDSLPVGPLAWVVGFGAEDSVRISDLIGAPVLFDPGGGLPPGPPAPGRLGHRPQHF